MLSGIDLRLLYVQSATTNPFVSFEYVHFALGLVVVASIAIWMDEPIRKSAETQQYGKHHHLLVIMYEY